MKIFIEDYKGQVINYDDNSDKFTCDISVEDNFKTTNRKSLNDVRKEIDTFIKLNVDFKPFDAMEKYYNEIQVVRVEAIRSDGKFIVLKQGKYKSLYDKNDVKKLFAYSKELDEESKAARAEFDEASKIYDAKKKAIAERLTESIDLSKYEHIINRILK